jgi:tryptophan synthase alpha chain
MTLRIKQIFDTAKAQNRAALITFIMGGDPDLQTTGALLSTLPQAGADIIEIGVPFSDPMADGPVIEAAGKRAISRGTTLKKILDTVSQFRTANTTKPIILMGYYNPIYRYGVQKFCKDAGAAGVDGLIIVDLPPEEEREITPHLEQNGLFLVRLIAPTSNDERVKKITASASGFVYYISVAGVTGAATASSIDLAVKLEALHKDIALPIAVGFGIKTAQQVKEAAKHADAVVVGSALVSVIAESKNPVQAAGAFVMQLAAGLSR